MPDRMFVCSSCGGEVELAALFAEARSLCAAVPSWTRLFSGRLRTERAVGSHDGCRARSRDAFAARECDAPTARRALNEIRAEADEERITRNTAAERVVALVQRRGLRPIELPVLGSGLRSPLPRRCPRASLSRSHLRFCGVREVSSPAVA